jgi:uncharacterized protein YkwD
MRALISMRTLIVSSLFLLLGGCASIEQALRPAPPDPTTLMPALETRIAILIADERSRLAPNAKFLVIDPELGKIARKRAADMATKNYFAHTAPNGDTSASLLMAEDVHFQGLLGENMAAQHYTPALGIDIDAFARRFVATWLASASHKENLSFPDYNRTGVGAAANGDTVYVTQLFATDLGLGPHPDSAPRAVVTPLPNAKSALTPPPHSAEAVH